MSRYDEICEIIGAASECLLELADLVDEEHEECMRKAEALARENARLRAVNENNEAIIRRLGVMAQNFSAPVQVKG